jgi:histidine triad (HIT) family protein
MNHAPPGYECPFCGIAGTLPSPAPESAVVLMDANVFALVPTHHYAGIRGNCLVVPRRHYENVLDIPDSLGTEFFRATRSLAHAMRKVFRCEGISTRQHNGPAGDQDVWHYHLHVIPRYPDDGLHAGCKVPYASGERIELAARLRAALHQVPLACEPDGRDLHAGHSSN